jgi:hypothetical protein
MSTNYNNKDPEFEMASNKNAKASSSFEETNKLECDSINLNTVCSEVQNLKNLCRKMELEITELKETKMDKQTVFKLIESHSSLFVSSKELLALAFLFEAISNSGSLLL